MPEPYRVYNPLATGTVTFLFSDIDAAFDRAWQEGRVLTLKQAIELASEDAAERP